MGIVLSSFCFDFTSGYFNIDVMLVAEMQQRGLSLGVGTATGHLLLGALLCRMNGAVSWANLRAWLDFQKDSTWMQT